MTVEEMERELDKIPVGTKGKVAARIIVTSAWWKTLSVEDRLTVLVLVEARITHCKHSYVKSEV